MSSPEIAGRKPCYMKLEENRAYVWCACGRSKSQPFCDGSHKGTEFRPVSYRPAELGEEVLFCLCKKTKTPPFCDGSHNNIPGAYKNDDPDSPENRAIEGVERAGAKTGLDGACYVFAPDLGDLADIGGAVVVRIISEEQGAKHQSQFRITTQPGASPVLTFGDRHCILFIAEGAGEIVISGRRFAFSKHGGVYIRPGESFQIVSDAPVSYFASACPAAAAPETRAAMDENFDAGFPDRIVEIDEDQRNAMADRYFQILVNKSIGSTMATQFIGHIPESKAEPHRHLYEEALIIVSGEGVMWTKTKKTPVKAGDVIFLPQRELHSLQCTDKNGMDVVGVIYPGDNPAINY